MDIKQSEFEGWLAQFSGDQTVGQARSITENPVARFILSRTDEEDVFVTPVRYSVGGSDSETPQWVRFFLHEVDINCAEGVSRADAENALDALQDHIDE